jgi:dephospho-CoA kinase
MRQLVFADNSAKQRLERILHPLILEQSRALAEASTAPYILIVIPLLFETATYRDWLNRTLVVDCAESTQIRRVVERGALGEAAVLAIMSHQLPRTQRLQLADDVIQNESGMSALEPQVDHLHQAYLKLSERSN